MHPFTLEGDNYLAVEIAEDATNIHLKSGQLYFSLGKEMFYRRIDVKGTWQIAIPSTLNCTEEEAKTVVKCIGFEADIGYGGAFLYPIYGKDESCWSALASLRTLLSSYGITTNCTILKKVK